MGFVLAPPRAVLCSISCLTCPESVQAGFEQSQSRQVQEASCTEPDALMLIPRHQDSRNFWDGKNKDWARLRGAAVPDRLCPGRQRHQCCLQPAWPHAHTALQPCTSPAHQPPGLMHTREYRLQCALMAKPACGLHSPSQLYAHAWRRGLQPPARCSPELEHQQRPWHVQHACTPPRWW